MASLLSRSFRWLFFIFIIGVLAMFLPVQIILVNRTDISLTTAPKRRENLTDDGIERHTAAALVRKDADEIDAESVIHFIESSGERCLRPRQACSIESAAVSNPDMTIQVHLATEPPPGKLEHDEGEGLVRHCKTIELMQAIPNVKIVRENLLSYLKDDTSLKALVPMLNNSNFALQHLTDAVRVAMIYKLGGVYSDIDSLIFKSLRGLRNTAGYVFIDGLLVIENGLLIFDRGSDFLKHLMHVMVREYKRMPNKRSSLGWISLKKAIHEYCPHTRMITNLSIHKHSCKGGLELTLLNHTAFYPIGYPERDTFFAENFSYAELRKLEDSYSSHIYGSAHGAHVPETSLYAFLAKRYCPAVYEEHKKGVYVF